MKTFFTADSHFTLKECYILNRDFRPFKDLKTMNREIVKIWNKQAKKHDIIYHLGDFVNYYNGDDSYKETFKLIKKINAKVILIIGNNEERLIKHEFNGDKETFKQYLLHLGFKDVIFGGMYLELKGKRFYLNHFPKNHVSDAINLFGHIHGSGFVKKYGFNVGIDNHYLRLFSEDDIFNLIENIPLYDENVYE